MAFFLHWFAGGAITALVALAPAASFSAAAPEPPQRIEERPEPLAPERPRTDEEQDRIDALGRFSAARIKEQQREFAAALRLYQRAARLDPNSKAAHERAVILAAQLDRAEEAAHYAPRAAELGVRHPALFRTLAIELSEAGRHAEALRLFAASLEGDEEDRRSASRVLVRMEMGRLAFVTKDFRQAAAAFDDVREALANPDDFGLDAAIRKVLLADAARTYEMMGQAYLEINQSEAAAAAFDKGVEASGDKSLKTYFQARVEARAQRHDKAVEALDAYFAAKPKSRDMAPYELLAAELRAAGKAGEIIPRLEKLRGADGGNSFLGYFLADEYRRANQLDKARPLYEELIREKPVIEGYRALAHILRVGRQDDALLKLLGEVMAKNGDLEILGDEEKSLRADRERLIALVALARNKHKTAADDLDYGQRLAAAHLALAAKDYDAAGDFFALALKVKSDAKAEVLLTWGIGLLVAEQNARAAEVFRRGLEEKVLPSDNPAFYFYLAGALSLDNRHDEALSAAQKAVAVRENDPRFAARVAWVLYRAKRVSDAEAAYRRVLEKFTGEGAEEESRRVAREARLSLSSLYANENRLADAEELLEQVLDENPNDVGALNDLGYLWADQGKRLGKATKMLERAVRAEPDNTAYRDSLGWAYFRVGRLDDARRELEKAVQDEDPDGVVLDHLGDLYHKLGQSDKARELWTRAAAAFKKTAEPVKMKQVEDKLNRPGS